MAKGLLINLDRCTGCDSCIVACKLENRLPLGSFYNKVIAIGPTGTFPDVEKYWLPSQCQQCENPQCVAVCPTGASYRDPETGYVLIDKDKCIGCQYCRSGCPFDVPRHTGVGVQGAGIKIDKCTGCIDRVRNGRKPACVTTCQPNALDFGPRSEMLEKAHARVDALKEKGFADASVYGETECGGCHTIMVLKYDRSMYTHVPENAEPNGMTEALGFMKPLAAVGAVGIVAGLGLSFLTGVGYKRDRLYYDEKAHDEIDVDTGEVVKHIDKEKGER